MFRAFVLTILCLAAAVPAAAQGPATCDLVAQNLYVRDMMTDLYFWYQHVPEVDAAAFESPEAYLEAVRYRTLDSSFSYIAPRASTEAFFSNSQFIGFGLSYALVGPDALQLTDVFADSPALDARLARGDRITEINGSSVEELSRGGGLADAFGPAEEGVEASVLVERGVTRFRATMVKRIVTIPTISLTRVYTVGSRKVGYLVFRNFVEPSYAALDTAFNELRAQGVNELVLDLRYNGGGLVGVARHLASLIGGTRTNGSVFVEYTHNDRYSAFNQTTRFEPKPNALTLDRLFVIATRATASASEQIINSLSPFMPVHVIGDRTYGKPVGQYAISFCDKTAAPVSFVLRNANGEGDFYDGIPPTCAAEDDLSRPLGDPQEASLREALRFIETGRCSRRTAASSAPERTRPLVSGPLGGWQAIVNAH
jgi:C-terminal processing protease CtpA/Prc